MAIKNYASNYGNNNYIVGKYIDHVTTIIILMFMKIRFITVLKFNTYKSNKNKINEITIITTMIILLIILLLVFMCYFFQEHLALFAEAQTTKPV